MNTQGLVLVILTLLFICGQFIAHRWIKKVTNSYWFWLAVGAISFIWLIVFRFAGQFSKFWNYGPFTDPGSYTQSVVISQGLMLDMCPLAAFLLCILCMADPSRKIARAIAPIALLGGLMTVGSMAADDIAELSAKFIFIGGPGNECYFIMHFLQATISVGIMLNTPRYGWKGWVSTFIMATLMYAYVGICVAATGARWNISGLGYNDWTSSGEYHFVAEMFHLPIKACPWIGIPFLYCVASLFIFLKDYVMERGWFKYGNAYSGKWYSWYNYNKYVKQKWL